MNLTRKRLIFLLRLLVIITASYLMLFSPGGRVLRFWVYCFIAVYMLSNLILSFLPEELFLRPKVFYGIVIFDILMLAVGIYFTRMGGTDLYLVFFLIVCLATLGSELKNLFVAGLVFSFVYGWLLYRQGLFQSEDATSYALRIPFILVVTIFLGYIVDTQTKERQRALEESEKRFKGFVSNLPVGTFQMTLEDDPRFLLANRAFFEMFGADAPDEAIGMPVSSCLGAEGKRLFDLVCAADSSINGDAVDFRRDDGSVLNSRLWARRGEHEGAGIVEGVIIDETRLRRVEHALGESEKRLKAFIDASFDLVYEFIPRSGSIIWFGDTQGTIGRTPEDIDSIEKLREIVHPDDVGRFMDMAEERAAAGEVRRLSFEYRVKRGDGSWRYFSDQSIPLMDEEGEPERWIGACADITDRKELELQLQEAQKMESVGLLAGGIAHNFNNILMGIQGYVLSMLMSRQPDDNDYEALKSIEESVAKAAGLVKNLLGFARGGAYNPATIDLNAVIRSENRLFCEARKDISIHEELAEGLWAVNVDENQIQQVLLNLYINAAQAMPEKGGDIFVKTENVVLTEEDLRGNQGVFPGNFVRITVKDNGCGMDPETLEKIFEPFFTTKSDGTGLGLSSVYGIVLNYGGFIRVESKKGEGSAFFIYLPAEGGPALPKEAGVLHEGKPRAMGDGERILVVDDEQMVAKACERLLKRLGYEVVVANSGKDAVEIYREQKDRIDMVLLDLLMPGMSGGETYDALKSIDPKVKVLLSSGFSLNRQARDILDRGCDGFIQKPYNINEISVKIRKVLEGA